MNTFIDDLQRSVELSVFPPQRIVSLVPSQTELLHDLGLDKEVVGITKFCVHPQRWKKEKRIVGGTKQVHMSIIQELQPDIIIANQEENTQEIVEACSKIAPVYVTDIKSLEDAFRMIMNIGKLVDKVPAAQSIQSQIIQEFDGLRHRFSGRFLYFIWQDPYMVAGKNTFIDAVLSHFGFENAVSASRYPMISEADIRNFSPEYLFLSSEPYPFKEKHIIEFSAICPRSKVYLVDGEMFSWYGSRMRYTCAYVKDKFLL